jgi:hypothetical protein
VWSGITFPAGFTSLTAVVTGGVSSAFLYRSGSGAARAIVQGGEMAAAFDIFFAGQYRI